MANSQTIQITLKAVSDFSDIMANVKKVQGVVDQLKLPDSLKGSFVKTFSEIEVATEKASKAMANGFKTKGDVAAFENAMQTINSLLRTMGVNLSKISDADLARSIDIDTTQVEAAAKRLQDLQTELTKTINAAGNLDQIDDAFKRLQANGAKGTSSVDKFLKAFKSGDIEEAKKHLENFTIVVEENLDTKHGEQLYEMWERLNDLIANVDVGKIQQLGVEMEEAKEQMKGFDPTELEKMKQVVGDLVQRMFPQFIQGAKGAGETIADGGKKVQQFNSELEQIKHRIAHFFGLANAVNLFKRAVRSAFETVKDLDKIMTETAVVTNFSVGDMWKQLPEYTQRANELGVSIHGAYEAATLFYQQGLKTNEVVAVSNETLKMARIAGLDAAEATDRMTNALRGFNMSIDEASAKNINDVYSNLAAKTASDVDEISTAMTKVASLAHNANMSFENTAAFLSQIIETTRESAETAGTALKTVIARFSEVKNLYSTGDLLGKDANGDEIDVNKVSKALRSAGINLNEYLTGMKGLDDIFMELSAKWDSLDQVQQRYIATMAAGSRQQSRFIALMQDNARMTELVREANNSAGASQEQFDKTLESLESKLNRLKNSWDSFLMSLTNSSAIKTIVDILNGLLTIINKMTDSLPGLLGSFTRITTLIVAFKVGRNIFNKLFASVGSALKQGTTKINGQLQTDAKQSGQKAAKTWVNSFKSNLKKNGGKGLFKSFFTKQFGGEEFTKDISKDFIKNTDKALQDLDVNLQDRKEIYVAFKETGYDGMIAKMKDVKLTKDEIAKATENLDEKTKNYNGTMQQTSLDLSNIGMAFTAVGGAISMLGQIFDDGTESGKETAKIFQTVGSVFMGVGSAAMALGSVTKVLGITIVSTAGSTGKALFKAGITAKMGWAEFLIIIAAIAAAIAALVFIIKAIKDATPEAQLKKAKEAAQAAAEAANEAAEAYKNLGDAFNSLGDKYNKLEELTEGTREWRDAVQEINSDVLDLIEKYPELAALVKNEKGVLRLDIDDAQTQAVLEQYNETALKAASAKAQSDINVIQKTQAVEFKNLLNTHGLGGAQVGKTHVDNQGHSYWIGNQDVTEDVARQIAQGQLRSASDIEQYVKAQGLEISATEENIKALRQFGDSLLLADKKIEVYYESVANNALQMAEIDEQMQEAASNYLDPKRIENLYNKALDKTNKIGEKNYNTQGGEYRKYWEDIYGAEVNIDKYGAVTYKEGNESKTITAEEAKQQYAMAKATKDAADAAEDFAINLKKASPALKKIYDKKEGGALTKKDLDNLGVTNVNQFAQKSIKNIQEDLEKNIKDSYKELNGLTNISDEEFEKYLEENAEDWKIFQDEYAESVQLASRKFQQAIEKIGNTVIQQTLSGGKFAELNADQLDKFTDGLSKVYAFGGEELADGFAKNVNIVMGSLGDKADDFIDYLNVIDWTNIDDIEDLGKELRELGIPINVTSESFQNMAGTLLEVAKASQKVDVKKIQEAIEALNPIRAKFIKGEATRSWTKAEFEQMQPHLSQDILDKFTVDVDGNYVYLGNSMDKLREAVNEATYALREEGIENLTEQAETRDKIKGINVTVTHNKQNEILQFTDTGGGENAPVGKNIRGNNSASNVENLNLDNWSAGTLEGKQALADAVLQEMSEEVRKGLGLGISEDTTAKTLTESGLLDAFLEAATLLSTDDTIEERIDKLKEDNAVQEMYGKTWTDIIKAAATGSTEETEVAVKAALVKAFETGMDDAVWQQLEQSKSAASIAAVSQAYTEAQDLGIDTTKLAAYTEQLQKQNDEYKDNIVLATRVALNNFKLNQAVKSIVSSYEDWNALIDENGKLQPKSSGDFLIYDKLKKDVAEMLGITEDAADQLLQDKDYVELIQEVAKGTEGALDKLNEKLTEKAKVKIEAELDEGKLDSVLDIAIDAINSCDLPTLRALVEMDPESQQAFFTALSSLLQASGWTADQLNAIFGKIGYTVKVTYKDVEFDSLVPGMRADQQFFDGGDEFLSIDHGVAHIPQMHFEPIDGWTPPNDLDTDITYPKDNGGSSSGSSSKPSYWTNPYDELYNLQEKINKTIREREALERRYQKLLKSSTASLEDIRKGYRDQIAALQEELRLQQQLAQGKLGQISRLGNQLYTDENGNRRSFNSYNVQRYAQFNAETGEITIDWAALEAIANDPNRSDEGKAIETYINKLQELVQTYQGVRDAVWKIEDEMEQLQQEAIDSYIGFENRVMEALVSQYQKEIDSLEKINDTINDATSKMLDSIQEQIEAQRQERQNTKTEEEIAKKEARLAYLRLDTSGANSLEIMQLEKELEEARQNYEDSLIDQALEQMRKDADLAAEQRAQQIEMMRAQLKQAQDSGALWNEVYGLINGAFDENGEINMDSDLVKLLQAVEGFDAFSAFGQDEWIKKFVEALWQAWGGLEAGGASSAGEHQGNGNSEGPGGSDEGPGEGSGGPGNTGGGNTSEEYPYGKASEVEGTVQKGSTNERGVKAIQWALNHLGMTDSNGNVLTIDGNFGNKTEQAVKKYQRARNLSADGKVGRKTKQAFAIDHYKTGGLADYTGLAWLDGTKSHPELVLNARDTENFVALKNILASLMTPDAQTNKTFGDAYFDIDINADISSDYDVDQLADRIKQQIVQDARYRNINMVNFMR